MDPITTMVIVIAAVALVALGVLTALLHADTKTEELAKWSDDEVDTVLTTETIDQIVLTRPAEGWDIDEEIGILLGHKNKTEA